MNNLRVRVTWPITRQPSGRSLQLSEISGALIGLRVVGAPSFTPFGVLPATQATDVFEQLALDPGDYEVEVRVADTQTPAEVGPAVVRAFTIRADAPGPAVVNVELF